MEGWPDSLQKELHLESDLINLLKAGVRCRQALTDCRDTAIAARSAISLPLSRALADCRGTAIACSQERHSFVLGSGAHGLQGHSCCVQLMCTEPLPSGQAQTDCRSTDNACSQERHSFVLGSGAHALQGHRCCVQLGADTCPQVRRSQIVAVQLGVQRGHWQAGRRWTRQLPRLKRRRADPAWRHCQPPPA